MSKLSLVGGDAGIGEVLLHAPETDETRIYDFPDETGTFALREYDIRNLDEAKANRAGDTFTGVVHFSDVVTLQAPTDNNHAATKKYVDDKVSALATEHDTDISNLSNTLTGNLNSQINTINGKINTINGNISTINNNINTINGNINTINGNINTINGKLVLASTAEAQAGTNTTKLMTPARTKEAIQRLAPQPDLTPYYRKTGGAISGSVTISGATQVNNNLTVTGTARAQTFQSTSDVRLKDGLERIDSVLDKLDRIHLYRYNFHDNDQVKHLGLIAQEVVRVFPELVSKDENGYLAIDYNGMTAVLLQAVKELGKELAQK